MRVFFSDDLSICSLIILSSLFTVPQEEEGEPGEGGKRVGGGK